MDGDDEMNNNNNAGGVEVPLLWQLAKPKQPLAHHREDSVDSPSGSPAASPGSSRPPSSSGSADMDDNANKKKNKNKAPLQGPFMGKLLRLLHDTSLEDPEELRLLVSTRDPATGQSLLQWASLNGHFLLVEWLVKKMQRRAFAFDAESPEMLIYEQWQAMLPELQPQLQEEVKDAARIAQETLKKLGGDQPLMEEGRRVVAAMDEDKKQQQTLDQLNPRNAAANGKDGNGDANNNNNNNDGAEDENGDEEEEAEKPPTADELVYEELADYHEAWGPRGKGLVKQVRELGVYQGARRNNKQPHMTPQEEQASKTAAAQADYDYSETNGGGNGGGGALSSAASSTTSSFVGAEGGDVKVVMEKGQNQNQNQKQSARLAGFTKEGLGQSLFFNGDCYCGVYRDNMRHGKGTYYWSSTAMCYTGDWVQNQRHGRGRMVYPDGGKYIGPWAKDKKHGSGGRYTYADGSTYEGEWVNNAKHGYGVHTFRDGSKLVGTFVKGEFAHGEWRLASSGSGGNGDTRYVGSFVKGVPDGPGVFLFRCNRGSNAASSGAAAAGGVGSEGSGVAGGGAESVASKFSSAAFASHAPQTMVVQEGFYKQGVWHPNPILRAAKDTITPVSAKLSVVVHEPQQPWSRVVPMTFARDRFSGGTLYDLILVANSSIFQNWSRSLRGDTVGVERIEVTSITYAGAAEEKEKGEKKSNKSDFHSRLNSAGIGGGGGSNEEYSSTHQQTIGIQELRLRVWLQRPISATIAPASVPTALSVEEVVLVKPTTRLLVLLKPTPSRMMASSGSNNNNNKGESTAAAAYVVLEKATNLSTVVASSQGKTQQQQQQQQQLRLPRVERAASSTNNGGGGEQELTGDFVQTVAPALRLTLSSGTALSFLSGLQTALDGHSAFANNNNNCSGNAPEDVLLYVQQVHPETIHTIPEKLARLKRSSSSYVLLPIQDALSSSSSSSCCDAVTIIAITQWMLKSEAQLLPLATVRPQRAPTPTPPAPEPRPPLEPLIAERAQFKRRQMAIMRDAMRHDEEQERKNNKKRGGGNGNGNGGKDDYDEDSDNGNNGADDE